MPRGVHESLRAYCDTWAERGVRAWADAWWDLPVRLGDLLGPILGTRPGEVSFHQNVTLAQAVVLSCHTFEADRPKVVLSDMEFPSVMYLYEAQRNRGAEICIVESRDGIGLDLERFLEAIDERTLLVPLSHVLFRSSFIVEAEAVVRKAHEVGARVIFDVYQSAGVLPVDLPGLQVDFAVGGCLKWLCGGPGAAFLYVRPELRNRLEPTLTGWMAHEHAFDFETGPIRYRDDSFRFLNGTPHIPCLYAARPGLEIVGQIGVARIRENSMRQTAYLADLARAQGFELRMPGRGAERGGTVAVCPPFAYEVSRELLRREFLVDYRPGAGIRISPHFYTTDGEIESVVEEIRKILDSKAYEKHLGSRSYVT